MADYFSEVVNILLKDRTTGKNIIWATGDYVDKGHQPTDEIISAHTKEIEPHNSKSVQRKKFRVRSRAEVFTPHWICEKQNYLVNKIFFSKLRAWEDYVKATRLEITCGEAPYLVSPYDATSGETIPLKKRIGLLDKKFRVINKNVSSIEDWVKWAKAAVQSVYGYEFQGDNLFLARKNIFESVVEYYAEKFSFNPSITLPINFWDEVAKIISWNLWQMDGLTNAIPYYVPTEKNSAQTNLFEPSNVYCRIMDWQKNEVVEFRNL